MSILDLHLARLINTLSGQSMRASGMSTRGCKMKAVGKAFSVLLVAAMAVAMA